MEGFCGLKLCPGCESQKVAGGGWGWFPEPVKAAAVGFGTYRGATVQGRVGLSPSLLAGRRAGCGELGWKTLS